MPTPRDEGILEMAPMDSRGGPPWIQEAAPTTCVCGVALSSMGHLVSHIFCQTLI